MTDDIEELKAALRNEGPITPPEGARQRAIDRAMLAFDGKYAAASKGTGLGDRLKGTATAVYQTLIGRRSMKLNPALAGGASLSVLALAILSATYIQTGLKDDRKIPERLALRQPAQGPGLNGTGQQVATDNEKAEQDLLSGDYAISGPSPTSPTTLGDRLARSGGLDAAGPAPLYAPQPGIAAYEPAPPAIASRTASEMQKLSPDGQTVRYYQDQGRDKFATIAINPVKLVSEEPVSTFSIDVDTASYGFVRASLNNNVLPQANAVRVEELINYFPYDYARPDDASVPFKASVSVFPAPWSIDKKLIHIGIKGFEFQSAERPHANLVYLIDTSGSMDAPNKLPLVRNAMRLLLESLKPDDTVAIVTYAGSAGTVLEPTPVKDKAKILAALDNLHSGGSTAGAEGIRQAYQLAQQNLDENGVNRVILATDGDFNVGITDQEELKSYIERQRKTGIFLSVLGFGMGNYNDALMHTLAQNGNGHAAYIDNLNEARKVLVEEAGSTLFTIAKDVKIQVEFNPAAVSEYRLIGYETRLLNREDFNNDKVDAGDIGSGHTVTAIYEFTPRGSGSRLVDDLRYGNAQDPPQAAGASDEYAFLKIRYKLPDEETSKLITTPVTRAVEHATADVAPNEARFATAVAAWGQILRGGRHTDSYTLDDVIGLAQGAKGKDEFGYRAEFINLVRLSKSVAALQPLSSGQPVSPLPR
ncbi:MAG: VWA domain-containing protein [Hyphomicrobiales bacterium]|nr:VWA domain-containing protein [Hyphomicrobiales bacterium]